MPKKTVTAKQLAANRANAKKSTGPRTPQGKAAIAHNHLTHGLCSHALIIPEETAETIEAFDALLAGLRVHLAPVGELENLLVERIAVCHWRFRRAYRFEARAIRDLRLSLTAARAADHDSSKGGGTGSESPATDTEGLPDRNALERLVRYEGLIDRELHRAMTQLHRIQSLRRQIQEALIRAEQELQEQDEDEDDDRRAGEDAAHFLQQFKAMQALSALSSRPHSATTPPPVPAPVDPPARNAAPPTRGNAFCSQVNALPRSESS